MEETVITKEWLCEILAMLPGKEKQREILERPELHFIVPYSVVSKENVPSKFMYRREIIARYDFSLQDWIIIII